MKEQLVWYIKKAVLLDDGMKGRLLTRLHTLDRGCTALCHGDFHPLNIIDDGNRLWILDWVDATAGDPLADICQTYLIFKRNISRLADVYLRSVCRAAKVRQEDALAWLPVVAATWLTRQSGEDERAFVMGIIESSMM